MVICLGQGADLHMAKLMPLPLTIICFSKIQIGFTFLVPAHPCSLRQNPDSHKTCVCVHACMRVSVCAAILTATIDKHMHTYYTVFQN